MHSPNFLNLLKKHFISQKKTFILLGILIFSHVGFRLSTPQIFKYFVDSVLSASPMKLLIGAGILYTIVVILIQVFKIFITALNGNLAWSATNAIRTRLLAHCLNLDQQFHHEHLPGEMIERIDGDSETLSNFFSNFSLEILSSILMLIGVMIFVSLENGLISALLIIYSIVNITILMILPRFSIPAWTKTRAQTAEMYGFIEESLIGVEDIRTLGETNFILNRIKQYFLKTLKFTITASWWSHSTWACTNVLYALVYAIGIGIGVYNYYNGNGTVGSIFLIVQYISLFFLPLDTIKNQIDDLQKAVAGFKRIQDLLDQKPSIVECSEPVILKVDDKKPWSISFENVSFSYVKSNPIIKNISFQCEPGMVCGVVGPSGSGKTTIARLLLRLYEPDAGFVKLNGIDISQMRLQQVRESVGFVTQEVQLFKASLRDNCTLFDNSINDQTITDVLCYLGFQNWFKSLPKGLDTIIDEKSAALSAGEIQLLACCRLFFKEPKCIILDEASSRLDPYSQNRFQTIMDELLKGKTGIIIAHRLETLSKVDYILCMDKGEIVEFGPRHELLENQESNFYRLLTMMELDSTT